jgi:hypothetical protein
MIYCTNRKVVLVSVCGLHPYRSALLELAFAVWETIEGVFPVSTSLTCKIVNKLSDVNNHQVVQAELVNEGIRLDRHYVFRYCSPTRRSFLSGRFPNRITSVQPDGCVRTATYRTVFLPFGWFFSDCLGW